jgi:hypothetical protein
MTLSFALISRTKGPALILEVAIRVLNGPKEKSFISRRAVGIFSWVDGLNAQVPN